MTPEQEKEMLEHLDKIEAADEDNANYDSQSSTGENEDEIIKELEVVPTPVELEKEVPEEDVTTEETPATIEEPIKEEETPAPNNNTEEEETPEVVEDTPDVAPTTDEYITLDDDDRKFKIKYKGEDMEIDAKDVKNLTQIGIDAQNRGYKGAISRVAKLDASGVTEEEVAMLAKFKAGDTGALKGLIANSKLDLEAVRENVFEYEQTDVDDARQSAIPVARSEFEIMGDRLTSDAIETYTESTISAFPELDTYRQRLIDTGDTETFGVFLSNLESGTWNKIAPKAAVAFSNLTDADRSSIKSNTKQFNAFINPFLIENSSQTRDENSTQNNDTDSTESVKPNTKVDAGKDETVDVSTKAAYAKPTGTPPVVGNKPKSAVDEITELTAKYEAMSDDEFNNHVRSGKR